MVTRSDTHRKPMYHQPIGKSELATAQELLAKSKGSLQELNLDEAAKLIPIIRRLLRKARKAQSGMPAK